MSRGLTESRVLDCCLFCGTCADEHGDGLCPACSSPLVPPERQAEEQSPGRTPPALERRHPLKIYAHWPLADPIEATLRGFSPNGLQFSAAVEFERDRLLKIDSDLIKALARVAYSRPGTPNRYVTSVEFLRLGLARPA
jgi:hypothetical protein